MATTATAVVAKNIRKMPTKITSYMAISLELLCANKGIAQISEQPDGT